jgi:hypothetical protein
VADGMGCKCAAKSASECGCPDVDWTPQELIDAREELKKFRSLCYQAGRQLLSKYRMFPRASLEISIGNALDMAADGEWDGITHWDGWKEET